MRETAKQMFDTAMALAPGLQNAGQEIKAELSRLGTQGSMELSSALFNGSAFVPYGPGQYTPSAPEHAQEAAMEHGHEAATDHGQQQETGRER